MDSQEFMEVFICYIQARYGCVERISQQNAYVLGQIVEMVEGQRYVKTPQLSVDKTD